MFRIATFGLLLVSLTATAAGQDEQFLPPPGLEFPEDEVPMSVLQPAPTLQLEQSLPSEQGGLVPTTSNTSEIGSPEMIAWLTQLVEENLPATYEDNRKWNKQREVLSGIHIELDGLTLKTHRNRKLVNAGTWTRYSLSLIEPDKNLKVEFHRLEPIDETHIAFDTTVTTPLEIHGQMAEWARDVKLFSLGAHARSTVRLRLAGEVQFQLNMLKLPPDIGIKPHVSQAHIELLEYRVYRISKIGGDAAELLGKSMRRAVEEKLADYNEKLVDKINTQLEKKRDKLSFSTSDWIKSKLPLPKSDPMPPK